MNNVSELSFNDLPKAMALLIESVSEIKNLLAQSQHLPTPDQQEKLLSIEEASKFLNLSVATIYTKVSKGELPVMKRGNRLYFSTAELMQYLKGGRKITHAEAEVIASHYLSSKNLNI